LGAAQGEFLDGAGGDGEWGLKKKTGEKSNQGKGSRSVKAHSRGRSNCLENKKKKENNWNAMGEKAQQAGHPKFRGEIKKALGKSKAEKAWGKRGWGKLGGEDNKNVTPTPDFQNHLTKKKKMKKNRKSK